MLLLISDSLSDYTASYLHIPRYRKIKQGGVAPKFLWYVTLPITLDVLGSLFNLGYSTDITMAIKKLPGEGQSTKCIAYPAECPCNSWHRSIAKTLQ